MHWARKIFHLTGVVVVLVYQGFDIDRALGAAILWGCAGTLALMDLLRARMPALQERFLNAFRKILDPKDERGINSSTLYFAGCAAAVTLFPRDPACAGILALAVGDSMAAIVGTSVKSPRLGSGSVAGSTACLVVATLVSWIFFPFWKSAVAGVAATVLEGASGSQLDNLTMPVGVAAVLYLL